MKLEPAFPPEPEPLKQDKGCSFVVLAIILLVVVGAAAAWILLWSGGHRDADKSETKEPPAQTAPARQP